MQPNPFFHSNSPSQSYEQQLFRLLCSVCTREEVAKGLGIQDLSAFSEKFWRQQCRAARTRFLCLLFSDLGMDLSLCQERMDEYRAELVLEQARRRIEGEGLTYKDVRE